MRLFTYLLMMFHSLHLMLGGLLSTVFESYMEAHNIQSDDSADTDMSTDNADSDNYDSDTNDSSDYTVSSDDYDYEALTYAGSYSGYGGYTINLVHIHL